MGSVRVPVDALYGPQTQRAVLNFPISGYRLPPSFIHALGSIKSLAANLRGRSDIEQAASAVARGEHDDAFVVDVFQTGSGTSTNMNANEVIAHLASRDSGHEVHPNDDVNYGQSSNDVIPTALHVAGSLEIRDTLLPAMEALRSALTIKAEEFAEVVKIGRTHLQDAVPMTLGQEFSGYAWQVDSSARRIRLAMTELLELPLGGTAVGTGLNAPVGFAAQIIAGLAKDTGIPFREAANHFEQQAGKDAVCFVSGALRTYAIALTKIANDIRFLGSGPRSGIGELKLPATQPGSSMMPGKVNPVIAESVLMVCAQVVGYDATIAWSAAAGNFELNVMMPVIAYNLLESIRLLASVSRNFAQRCIAGIEADHDRIQELVERSLSSVTALAPEIGYDRAAAIAKEAYESGRTIREVASERADLPADRLACLLNPRIQAGLASEPTDADK